MDGKPESVRTLPISGRIAEEDYTFLMGTHMDGQVTASEKLRHVCAFYRKYHEQTADFQGCLAQLNRLLEPAMGRIKEVERQEGIRSELLIRLAEALPEMLATLVTFAPAGPGPNAPKALREVEKQLHRQVLYLLQNILRLALTPGTSAYDEAIWQRTFASIQELVALAAPRT